MKKEYEQHYIASKQLEEMEDTSGLYAVFEEDTDRPKMYDLLKGVFDDREIALKYAEDIERDEKIHVASYNEYMSGNYNLIR